MKRQSLIALAILLLLAGLALVFLPRMRRGADVSVKTASLVSKSHAPLASKPARVTRMPAFIANLRDPAIQERACLAAIHGLPDDLTDREFWQLVDFISGPVPERRNTGDWYVVVNEIMNVLREPRFHIDGYSKALAGIVTDRMAGPVIRDYAAQHLALTLDRVAHNPTPADFLFVMEAFIKVVSSKDEARNDVTGTILMSLTAVFETFHPQDLTPYRKRLGSAILPLVSGDHDPSMSNRVSAIQAAGRLGFPEALPAIRRIAYDQTSNRWVRLSSIAALGYFARPEDRGNLVQLAGADADMAPAARTALKSIADSTPCATH